MMPDYRVYGFRARRFAPPRNDNDISGRSPEVFRQDVIRLDGRFQWYPFGDWRIELRKIVQSVLFWDILLPSVVVPAPGATFGRDWPSPEWRGHVHPRRHCKR